MMVLETIELGPRSHVQYIFHRRRAPKTCSCPMIKGSPMAMAMTHGRSARVGSSNRNNIVRSFDVTVDQSEDQLIEVNNSKCWWFLKMDHKRLVNYRYQ